MRSWIFAIAALLAVGFAPQAFAAPTCQTLQGETIRCGTPGAMPVGWTVPAEQREAQPSNIKTLLELFCILGVFFGVMALLPDFEGSRVGEWDGSADDGE